MNAEKDPSNPDQILAVALPREVWERLCGSLGSYADQARDGAQLRAWRDQIMEQVVGQTMTTAELVLRTGLPLTTEIGDVTPASYGRAVVNLLGRSYIVTLGDLAVHSDADLAGLKYLGSKRFAELREILRELANRPRGK